MFHTQEMYRLTEGAMRSDKSYGNNGVFVFPPSSRSKRGGARWLVCIISDGYGWEHVSVHVERDGKERTPFWEEMQEVKLLFWDKEDVVMQLHPAESNYVNNHPNVLHLWRPVDAQIPTPPAILVGIK